MLIGLCVRKPCDFGPAEYYSATFCEINDLLMSISRPFVAHSSLNKSGD